MAPLPADDPMWLPTILRRIHDYYLSINENVDAMRVLLVSLLLINISVVVAVVVVL